METRQITEVKIFALRLNPMRGNTEAVDVVAVAYDKQKLIDWYNSLKAPEPYKDYGENHFSPKGDMGGYQSDSHCFYKTFIRGSELEWYNPCYDFELDDWGQGIGDSFWVAQELIKDFKIIE